ncbi:MAG: bifunctional lysylphosphatidylglycerol flippase/synthetase MprF [Verrucomicrobiota bacterium]
MDLADKVRNLKRWFTVVLPFAWLALLALAVWSLGKEWGGFHLDELDDALRRIGAWHVCIALLLTAASLLCNASLDLVALRWLKKDLPVGKVLGTALIAGCFSMNGGGTILGGGAIRMRFYGQFGLGGAEIAKITGFLMLAGWLGHALLAGVMMCWAPPELDWLPVAMGRGIGMVLLLSCGLVCVFSVFGFRGRPLAFCPSWKVLLVATVVSSLDWLFAGLALRVFLPAEIPTPAFLAATAVGQALGAASHVPGGVGVMELFITKFSAGMVSQPLIAGALLTYRLTYYLIPFVIAVAAVSAREIWARRHWAKMTVDGTGKAWSAIAPRLAGMSALAGGFVLMLSATTPMEASRRILLERFVPLPFVEASHFLSSIAGTVMIIVASGLLRRVRAAWWFAVFMAGGGMVFSLLKGFDWEESFVLLVFLAALLPFKSRFHRHAGIWTRRFSLQWWGLIVSIVGLSIWFGFYTSRHVGYENQLWWRYSFEDDASRLLRGTAGSALILISVALIQYFRPSPPRAREPNPGMDRVAEMVGKTARCSSALALVGDKEFLFNGDRSAFLMYGDQGRTRVAMADPVGDEEKFEGLYWRFMEQAQDEGMRTAFYQVGASMMPVCVEMGMRIYKLGEEAMVPLDTFDLGSSELKKFRKVMNRMERENWIFEIWQPAEVAGRIGELKAVSDAWMAHHGAREKGFSLGKFDETYLCRLPVAVMRVEGKVIAFGNIWPGNGRDELSTDLMRHVPDAPNGVMDCLFVSMMLWGKERGYRWFDLGMAPLSGLSDKQFAPLWNRIGGLIYDKGEAFYNFNGLRAWKSKFQPVWHPRYLAISKAWDLPAAILDITTLIGKPSFSPRKESPAPAGEGRPTTPDPS